MDGCANGVEIGVDVGELKWWLWWRGNAGGQSTDLGDVAFYVQNKILGPAGAADAFEQQHAEVARRRKRRIGKKAQDAT
jgi:hypothetical protein